MKKGIHPKYETTVITCACGNKIETKSTTSITHVEICSACHPFFSGKQKLVDTAGRIERFKRKYNIKDAKKKPEEIKEEPVIVEEKPGQENQIQETAKEKIEEVKEKPETSAKKTGEIQEIPNKKITEAKAKPETEKKKPDEAKGKQETSKNKPVGVKNKKSEAAPDKTEKKPEEVKEKTK